MSVARAIGVMIRDAYFKHKEINVNEVDNFDPRTQKS
jgi:hypothetical protein